MATQQFRVSLNKHDAMYLKEIANKLGIRETDVLRKGLKLMSLYAESTNPADPQATSLILKEGDREREIIVL